MYVYIYTTYTYNNSSGEEDGWEERPSEGQIRGWRAVSAAGLQGEVWHKGGVFSQTPISRGKILHTRIRYLRNHRGFPVAISNRFSVA